MVTQEAPAPNRLTQRERYIRELQRNDTERRSPFADLQKCVAEQLNLIGTFESKLTSRGKLPPITNKTESGFWRNDLNLISAANALVHGGDMTFNYRFYQEAGGRTDERTFAALYGLTPVYTRRLSRFSFNPNPRHHLIQN